MHVGFTCALNTHQKQELALTFIDVAENRTLSVARVCFDEVSPLISFPPQWLIYLKKSHYKVRNVRTNKWDTKEAAKSFNSIFYSNLQSSHNTPLKSPEILRSEILTFGKAKARHYRIKYRKVKFKYIFKASPLTSHLSHIFKVKYPGDLTGHSILLLPKREVSQAMNLPADTLIWVWYGQMSFLS